MNTDDKVTKVVNEPIEDIKNLTDDFREKADAMFRFVLELNGIKAPTTLQTSWGFEKALSEAVEEGILTKSQSREIIERAADLAMAKANPTMDFEIDKSPDNA